MEKIQTLTSGYGSCSLVTAQNRTQKSFILTIFSQFDESSSTHLPLSVKDKEEFPFTVTVGNSICCWFREWLLSNLQYSSPSYPKQTTLLLTAFWIDVEQENALRVKQDNYHYKHLSILGRTMLTCLWERSPNKVLELLPLDLLCHCLFLPWKIPKMPMLENLLQKVIRLQLRQIHFYS